LGSLQAAVHLKQEGSDTFQSGLAAEQQHMILTVLQTFGCQIQQIAGD
jgi:hypothetical protein